MREAMPNAEALFESLQGISVAASETLKQVIHKEGADLAAAFYRFMSSDSEAAPYLAPKTVETRLMPGMMCWMESLFCCDTQEALAAALAMQRHVGEVHARGDIPVNLVARGMRLLKHEINQRLMASELEREELVEAVLHVNRLTDIAFEEMSAAFVKSHEQSVRSDETFRLVAAGHNISAERERQIGAVLDWENRIFRILATETSLDNLPGLRSSAFGLWLNHKAPLIFNDRQELLAIAEAVERIDQQLLPQLLIGGRSGHEAHRRDVVKGLLQEAEKIKFLMAEMFDRLSDLEVGRDTLTQLFNRRFLPSILKREIELCRRRNIAFAVLMVDVDHFKRVNDSFGHETGDRVLQQVAAHLINKVRAGDFVFRYGGEEFLIVLAEVDGAQAMQVAEKIRQRIEVSPLLISQERSLQVTVSVGVAASDGHPDYERMIERADGALYQAKREGRNRVIMAGAPPGVGTLRVD
jgi:diguanylate cyclase